MKIWIKSIAFGFLLYLAVCSVATIPTIFVTIHEKNESLVFLMLMKNALFIWFFVSAVVIWLRIKLVKPGRSALIARALFIWGPISLGWFLFSKTSEFSWFMDGMFLSSVFLVYEFYMVPAEREREKFKPKEKQ